MSKGLAATRKSKKAAQSASTPKADSLVTILEQALQSSDDALLEECLAVSKQRHPAQHCPCPRPHPRACPCPRSCPRLPFEFPPTCRRRPNALQVSDQRVVDMTVERLPSVRVLPFLLRLTDKVERRPNRGMNLCIW